VVQNWRTAPLSALDRALCGYAEKLTHRQGDVGPDDIDALRERGLDDVAIHDATQVIAYFNYITRVADGLGVEAETFVPPWGGESTGDPSPSDG
jgi:uncharacterized peroxidase-related enzyme